MVRKSFTFEGKRYFIKAKTEREAFEKMALKRRDLEEGRTIISRCDPKPFLQQKNNAGKTRRFYQRADGLYLCSVRKLEITYILTPGSSGDLLHIFFSERVCAYSI